MRIFLYILGFLIAAAVAVLPWVLISPITFITVLVSLAGVAMIVLLIVGLVKGWGIGLRSAAEPDHRLPAEPLHAASLTADGCGITLRRPLGEANS
jgi:hypothetical protein